MRIDGGPQFSSSEFIIFCQKLDIDHLMSNPYHPQGNGAAERAVQTAKRIFKTKNPTEALQDYNRVDYYRLRPMSAPHGTNNED